MTQPASLLKSWLVAALGAGALGLTGLSAEAQSAVFEKGDTVVTGFSGVMVPDVEFAPGTSPLDKVLIDPKGVSAEILRLTPVEPPHGQLLADPPVLQVQAKDVGQVFAITFDDAPVRNIYLGATAAFGLQIVTPDSDGDGRPERVKKGRPGATFMDGQWGEDGSPGTIYRIDGTTGEVTLFTTIGAADGPGLGDVVYDKVSRQFFASHLDTGLIYRVNANGTILGVFDHGVNGRPAQSLAAVPDDDSAMDITNPAFNSEDPATWGYTQKERRIGGMAVHDARLYYAVAEGPQVWSVAIAPDGSFGTDPRLEIDGKGLPTPDAIADIAFDEAGLIYLAQRGDQRGSYDYTVFAEPHTSSVTRYKHDPANPSAWLPAPDVYAVGASPDYRGASGGVDIGSGVDSSGQPAGSCNLLWSTGDALRPAPAVVQGLQGNDLGAVRPANEPPQQTYFLNYHQATADASAQGHVGDVEIWRNCAGTPQEVVSIPPDAQISPPVVVLIPGEPDQPQTKLGLTKKGGVCTHVSPGDRYDCVFTLTVTNDGDADYKKPITIKDSSPVKVAELNPDPSPPGLPWSCTGLGSNALTCTLTGNPTIAAHGHVDLGVTLSISQGNLSSAPCEEPNVAEGDDPKIGATQPVIGKIKDPRCIQPPTDISVTKEAFGCHDYSATKWICSYKVTVKNEGQSDFNGTIKLTDAINPTEAANAFDYSVPTGGTWKCSFTATGADCTIDPGLAASATATLTVFTKINKSLITLCKIDNTMTITDPVGLPSNSNAGNDKSGPVIDLVPTPTCNPGPPTLTNLRMEKKTLGACTLTGQVVACEFQLTVTNTSANEFKGYIKITDTPLQGGNVTMSTSEPGWTCPGPCKNYTADLAANGGAATFKAHVETTLAAVKANSCKLDNIGEIAKPLGSPENTDASDDKSNPPATGILPADLCSQPATPTDLSFQKDGFPCVASAAGGWDCQYYMAAINRGPGLFAGTVELSDTLPSGTTLIAAKTDPLCQMAGAIVTCKDTPPGTSVANATVARFEIWVHAPDSLAHNPATCKLANVGSIKSPQGKGNILNQDDTNDSNAASPAIATLPCDFTNLELKKSGSECIPADPAKLASSNYDPTAIDWNCGFIVTITNKGPGISYGPVVFNDDLPAGTGQYANLAGGPCVATSDPDRFKCTLTGPLAVGSYTSLNFNVKVPGSKYAVPGSCKIVNHAVISDPINNGDNKDPTDDSKYATSKIPQTAGPHLGHDFISIPCDPPNLDIAKKADAGGCSKVAGVYNCGFDITVTSKGSSAGPNDPYLGDIVVDEFLPQGATLAAVPSPWTCKPVDGHFECTYPETSLPPDPVYGVGGLAVGSPVLLHLVMNVPEGFAHGCSVTNLAKVHIPDALKAALEGDKTPHIYDASEPIAMNSKLCGKLQDNPSKCAAVSRMKGGGCCPGGQIYDGQTGCVPKDNPCKTIPGGHLTKLGTCLCPDGLPPLQGPVLGTCNRVPPTCMGPNQQPDPGQRYDASTQSCVCKNTGRAPPCNAIKIIPKKPPPPAPDCQAHAHASGSKCACDYGYFKLRGQLACLPRTCDRGTEGEWPNCNPIAGQECPEGWFDVHGRCLPGFNQPDQAAPQQVPQEMPRGCPPFCHKPSDGGLEPPAPQGSSRFHLKRLFLPGDSGGSGLH